MKKLILNLSIIVSFILLPIGSFAQFDYLDDLINNDQTFYDMQDNPISSQNGSNDGEISLNSIEMLWSTDSYVPYDYPGRALPAVDGFVDISLNISVSGGNPLNLQYSWFIDKMFDEAQSGYGRKNFRFGIRRQANETHTVLVKIFNDSNTFYFEKSVTIPITKPEVLIYPSIKNYFFSEQANTVMYASTNKTSTFVAKPFFFSIKKANDLNYRWRVNGQESINNSGYDANILNLSVPQSRTNDIAYKDLFLIADNGINFPAQSALKSVKLRMH